MYGSPHHWVEHENHSHRRVWRCYEHSSPIFHSSEQLKVHLREDHAGTLTERQISGLVDVTENSLVDNRPYCPICFAEGPFAKGLENHIANDLERIATFALPRGVTGGAEDSDAGSNASQGRSANSQASGESGSLIFSDTGGPRELDPESESPILPQAISATGDLEEEMSHWTIPNLPAFLLQSKAEIHQKFQDLEWLVRIRMAEASSAPTTSRWATEDGDEILQRNRYMNVVPFKHSRIHLKVPEGMSDYINASPITVKNSATEEETRYIATQAPKDAYQNHFWRMVWESTEDVAVIVMLTQVSEIGRDKSALYFPLGLDQDTYVVEDEDPPTNLPSVTLKLLEIYNDEETQSTVRKLELTVEGQTKPVWHFLFTSWPDFGVMPQDVKRKGLLNLLKVSAEKNSSPLNPLIVHCSAGVGRTGVYIALDHLLRELDSSGFANVPKDSDPVFDTVNGLREQRMMMVQGDAQYHFIYQVLREQWETRLGSSGQGSALLEGSSADPASSVLNDRSEKRAKTSS